MKYQDLKSRQYWSPQLWMDILPPKQKSNNSSCGLNSICVSNVCYNSFCISRPFEQKCWKTVFQSGREIITCCAKQYDALKTVLATEKLKEKVCSAFINFLKNNFLELRTY